MMAYASLAFDCTEIKSPDTKSDVIGDLSHDYRAHNSLHGRNAAKAIDIYNNLLAHY